jgi:transcriptional regulator with XRE-family HTH domain
MRIETGNSDERILAELGSRLAHTRLERNLSQADLAGEAGVGKRTVERLEAGAAVKSDSLIRVLRALGMLDALDRLVPEPLPSPIARRQTEGRRRRRAGGPRKARPLPPPGDTWRWGDGGGDPR